MSMRDNYDLFEQHEMEQERWLASRPVCCECEEHIQTDWYFEIDDNFFCEDCMDNHKHSTDSWESDDYDWNEE